MKPIYKYENYYPYISAFKANKYELSEVLTYIKDMMHIDINDKVYKSKYPPSELWKNWVEKQKISFAIGSKTIVLSSGHSFKNSEIKLKKS